MSKWHFTSHLIYTMASIHHLWESKVYFPKGGEFVMRRGLFKLFLFRLQRKRSTFYILHSIWITSFYWVSMKSQIAFLTHTHVDCFTHLNPTYVRVSLVWRFVNHRGYHTDLRFRSGLRGRVIHIEVEYKCIKARGAQKIILKTGHFLNYVIGLFILKSNKLNSQTQSASITNCASLLKTLDQHEKSYLIGNQMPSKVSAPFCIFFIFTFLLIKTGKCWKAEKV